MCPMLTYSDGFLVHVDRDIPFLTKEGLPDPNFRMEKQAGKYSKLRMCKLYTSMVLI